MKPTVSWPLICTSALSSHDDRALASSFGSDRLVRFVSGEPSNVSIYAHCISALSSHDDRALASSVLLLLEAIDLSDVFLVSHRTVSIYAHCISALSSHEDRALASSVYCFWKR